MRFIEGDKVMISRRSQWYDNDDKYNPKDIIGTIMSFDEAAAFGIQVKWSHNAALSMFSEADLRLVRRG